MTEDNQQLPDGATPLDPDEAVGLKPRLRTCAELNAFEQANIAQAMVWGRRSRILKNDLLNIDSLKLRQTSITQQELSTLSALVSLTHR